MNAISNKRMREMERIVHLVGGVLLLLHVYTPLADATAFSLVIRAGVFPILIGSGFAMWQLPRVRRWWNRRHAAGTRLA